MSQRNLDAFSWHLRIVIETSDLSSLFENVSLIKTSQKVTKFEEEFQSCIKSALTIQKTSFDEHMYI